MAPKYKDGDVALAFSAKWVSYAHTVVAYAAFLGALFVGVSLHYQKIVQNEYYVSWPRIPVWCLLTLTALGLSSGMVPIRVLDDWRSVSRALGLHGLHCHHVR
jgi:hypothetical protein